MEGYLWFPSETDVRYRKAIWCVLKRTELKSFSTTASEPSNADKWSSVPTTSDESSGVVVDLTKVCGVDISKKNDRLLMLRGQHEDEEGMLVGKNICIIAPSRKERNVWSIAFSASVGQNSKRIPFGVASALLMSLNSIEYMANNLSIAALQKEPLFRWTASPKKVIKLYRNLLLSNTAAERRTILADIIERDRTIDMHTLTGVVMRFLERFAETLFTSELYPEFAEIYKNSPFAKTKSKVYQRYQREISALVEEKKTISIVNKREISALVEEKKTIDEHEEYLPKIRELLLLLPSMNRYILKRIAQLCVAINKGVNTRSQLSILFCPTMVIKDNFEAFTKLRGTMVPVFLAFIKHSNVLFPDEQAGCPDKQPLRDALCPDEQAQCPNSRICMPQNHTFIMRYSDKQALDTLCPDKQALDALCPNEQALCPDCESLIMPTPKQISRCHNSHEYCCSVQ